MRRGSWVGALLLAALVAGLLWALRPERGSTGDLAPSLPAAHDVEKTSDLALAPDVEPRDDAPAHEPEVVPALPVPERPASGTAIPLVLVRVLEATDRSPVAEAVVSLRSPKLANPIFYECDENGEFEFEPAELQSDFGAPVAVVVRDRDGHARLRASVTLEPEVLLLVPAALVLGGEVVLPGLLPADGLNVSIWTSQADEGERFVGNETLEASSRFEIHASPVRVPDSFVVRVDRGGIPASVRVPTEELTSATGARIEVALARLAITVLDEVDTPLVRANVRVFLVTTQPTVTTRYGDAATGEDGIAHVWVPAGPIGVMAGAPRHTAESEHVLLAPGEGQVTIRLRRLSAADVVHGRVELDDGSPAPGAHVTAWFARDDGALSSSSMVQQSADIEGAFELAIATDRELLVTAVHKELGGSDRVRWQPGSGPARLVIQRGGTATVNGSGLRAREVGAGDIHVALVGPRGQMQTAGTDLLPLTFSHLGPGTWRIFSVAEGASAWAVGELRVETGKAAEVTLAFQPLDHVSGRVRGAHANDGTGVEFAPPGWPDVAVAYLLRRGLSEDGTFRVPGPLGSGELRVRVAGKVVERRPARVGAPIDFTLPQ